MKTLIIIAAIFLTSCTCTKIQLIPQIEMPKTPEVLIQDSPPLKVIVPKIRQKPAADTPVLINIK